jgi:voltage-gated potassium channel
MATVAFDETRPSAARAATMFCAALLFLALFAVILRWWNTSPIDEADELLTIELLALAWVPFVVEALLGYVRHPYVPGNLKRLAWTALLPPTRLTISTSHPPDLIWLPRLGWRQVDRDLYDRLERVLAMPMLWVALMILPIFGAELILKENVEQWPVLATALHVGSAFVWFAFAAEFLLMVSVADKKLDYCRKHWLNLAIILLPLLAFLRGIQVIRAFRVAQAGRLIRVYRMRSLMLRTYQGLVALSAVERLIHRDPHRHLDKLRDQLADKEKEIAALRRKIEEVSSRLAATAADDASGASRES